VTATRRCAVGAAVFAALLLADAPARAQHPAVLVVSPQGTANGWVDLGYLGDLHRASFEVDYTDNLSELSWDRIRQYNVLLIFTCPPDPGVDTWLFSGSPSIAKEAYLDLLERFLAAGGGVFVMAVETQIRATLTRPLLSRWGADLPLERIADDADTAFMTRMPQVPLVYTDQVLPSPVSTGVRGIWYPSHPHYNGAHTLPLATDGNWQVVVRAMPGARTVPVDRASAAYPTPPNALVRPGGVNAPPLFAIREAGSGRLALVAQWPTYSVGAGTHWLYDREVLAKGLQGKPSDFGRLMQNTFHWLATPSLESGALGGYRTQPQRLQPPNAREQVKNDFRERGPGQASVRTADPVLLRGIIGAQTRASDGQGTVADYADAARQAGLDFVVFLENFAALDAAGLAQLKADCAAHSDAQLTLYPGYRIDNNIGNHMFLFGPGVVAPPPALLTGPNKTTFMLQGESSPGVFGPTPPRPIDFLLSLNRTTQIGYYDFSHSGNGMPLHDARLYAMAGIRTYRNGTLIDDATDDYLATAQGTISPAPAAINLVSSPSALRAAVAAGRGLTYVAVPARAQLWNALGYTDQYTCANVFASGGPLIKRWPACVRVSTYGAEPFVTGRSRMDATIDVASDKGLREIRIYDGQQLYRRFKLNGEPRFEQLLRLEGSMQHNLVLVAEDVAGGRTVSGARRSWKDGSLAPVFCSDRINDCGNMFLAHGPYPPPVLRTPEVADPGYTWDGGPRGILTPIDFEGSRPRLQSEQGIIDGDQYDQMPLLEFADEGAVAVRSERNELIDPRVPAVNPWNTYGPRAPAPWLHYALDYAQFDRPSIGAPPVGWAAPPLQTGCNAAMFRGAISFDQPLAVRGLRVLRNWNWTPTLNLRLVVGRRQRIIDEVDLSTMQSRRRPGLDPTRSYRIGRGQWFGFYSPDTGNSQLFVNRGRPLDLRVSTPPGDWVSLWAPLRHAAAGDVYSYELFSVGCPVDAAARSADALAATLGYLTDPTGLSVTRGARLPAAGLLAIRPANQAVHLALPRPAAVTNLTVPLLVDGLNRRWSVGLWQLNGYVKGDYGSGSDRYRPVGVDLDGRAYIPLYPDLAEQTEIEVGHPVVADARGSELFLQVTALSGGTRDYPDYRWQVDVNNPTDQPITTVVSQNMALPGLQFAEREITLAPGEYRVLCCESSAAAPEGEAGARPGAAG